MTSVIIFNISGLAIILLLLAKKIEEKRRKPLIVLKLVSKSDIHIRRLFNIIIHFYSEGKDRTKFLFDKQLPMHSKNLWNKIVSYVDEKRGEYLNNMRDSRLLKKPDGLSEFFKNMSSVEKGNGEIHEYYEDDLSDDFQNQKKEVN